MRQQEEEKREFYEQESRNLRDNYSRVRRGQCKIPIQILIMNSLEDEINEERDKAQKILWAIMIIYAIILVSFVLLLYHIKSFRYFCYNKLAEINSIEHLGASLVGLVGYWFVLTGFNVVLYDIMAGFLIKPFWYALLVVSIAKFFAKYTGFLLGRYKIRTFIYRAMNENLYFITCYLACERKPVKVMFLLQFLAIPTIFKTYACGLFQMTHWEYIYPTIFGTVVWAAFWVYVGNRLDSIFEVLQDGNTSGYVPMWLNITMIIIVILVLIYLFQMTKAIYEEIEQDANLQSRISISIRGEEERKLGQQNENQIEEEDNNDSETGIRE